MYLHSITCERTRAENKCTCAGGTGATGTACPTHNAAKCVSCTDAGQYVDTNNECVACPAGSTCNGVTAIGSLVCFAQDVVYIGVVLHIRDAYGHMHVYARVCMLFLCTCIHCLRMRMHSRRKCVHLRWRNWRNGHRLPDAQRGQVRELYRCRPICEHQQRMRGLSCRVNLQRRGCNRCIGLICSG